MFLNLVERKTDVVHVLRVCLTQNIMQGMKQEILQISIRGSAKCQADEAQHSFVFSFLAQSIGCISAMHEKSRSSNSNTQPRRVRNVKRSHNFHIWEHACWPYPSWCKISSLIQHMTSQPYCLISY